MRRCIPTGLMALFLAMGCTSAETRRNRATMAEAIQAAEQGIVYIGMGTDAAGRNHSILQRDLRAQRSFTPEIWVRRDTGRRVTAELHDLLWRFDCRARTAQLVLERSYNADWSVGETRAVEGAAAVVAPNSLGAEMLEAVCAGAGRPPDPPFD